jgi:hypothetical protein
LEEAGFSHTAQKHQWLPPKPVDYHILIKKGDHISMAKAGVLRPLVIKTSPHKVPVAHIRTNMTTAGMSRDRFFELLAQVG